MFALAPALALAAVGGASLSSNYAPLHHAANGHSGSSGVNMGPRNEKRLNKRRARNYVARRSRIFNSLRRRGKI